MEQFLQMVRKHIQDDDPIVREFIRFMTNDFPYIPSELVNEQLEKALHGDSTKLTSTLLNNIESLDEHSIPILVQLLDTAPRKQKPLLYKSVRKIPTKLLVQHADQFEKHVKADFIQTCRTILEADEEALWETYIDLVDELEDGEGYSHQLYDMAKRVQTQLIEKGYYDAQKVAAILREELQEDYFSYNGILAVRAVGIMQLTEHIEVLASLLVRDEDILLEETADALIRFQSDAVVQVVAPYMKNPDSDIFATKVLKETKLPSVIDILVDAYPIVDEGGKEMVLDALTSHFSEKAFPLIEDFIAHDYCGYVMDMDEMFYGFYKVMGREHPKMDEWKRGIEEQNLRMKKASNMSHNDLANQNVNVPRVKSEPVTVTKIGRNDPCPCGSGKKHKKCCG